MLPALVVRVLRPPSVALGDPFTGALVAAGPDHLGELGFGQLLEDEPDPVTDEIDAVTALEHGEQVGQVRLIDRIVSFGCVLAGHTEDHPDGHPYVGDPRVT